MNSGRTVFAQLLAELPHKEFQKCVARYDGDRYLKKFSCWDQDLESVQNKQVSEKLDLSHASTKRWCFAVLAS